MARRPRTGGAVATAHQGGRPQRGLRHLLRRAVALGGGPVNGLLLRPLRLLWRTLPSLRSKNARRASAAADIARRHWRREPDDAPPRSTSILRRAVTRAGGTVDAALSVLQRALAKLQRDLSPSRALVVVCNWFRRLRRPRQPCQPRRVQTPPPPPPQQQQQQHPPQQPRGAWIYWQPPRPSTSPPPPSPPPPSSPRRRTYTVDGVVVPEGVVNNYAFYCRLASICPANWAICNFCAFEIQKAGGFRVQTFRMYPHCSEHHDEVTQGGIGVRCEEAGCSARVRPGPEQARHFYFCHRLPPDWWM